MFLIHCNPLYMQQQHFNFGCQSLKCGTHNLHILGMQMSQILCVHCVHTPTHFHTATLQGVLFILILIVALALNTTRSQWTLLRRELAPGNVIPLSGLTRLTLEERKQLNFWNSCHQDWKVSSAAHFLAFAHTACFHFGRQWLRCCVCVIIMSVA